MLAFLIIFIYSIINIIIWKLDNNETTKEITEIEESTEVTEVVDNENTEILPQKEEEIPEFNPYWDYIKMSLINVDFTSLLEINNDTVGWIQVGGTNINYPFVKTIDNKYYLTHSFNKSDNQAGWAFLDYRNNPEVFDKILLFMDMI